VTEKEKMLAGELYRPSDPELQAEMAATQIWLSRYNAAAAAALAERHALLKMRFGHVGEHVEVRPPFFCDYGFNISLGDGAVIGAASVVTRDVGPGQIVTGNPARPWTR
jgi:maltose O-acetyltransferase